MRETMEHIKIRALRRKSLALLYDISGYVVSKQLRQLQEMLIKYNPDQPRVPAGSPDGGQWTDGGGGAFPNDGHPDSGRVDESYVIDGLMGLVAAGALGVEGGVAALSRAVAFVRGLGSRDNLNSAQITNLARFEKQLPRGAGQTKIIKSSNESRIFQSDVPARNIPGSFARYEKTIDASGKTISYTKTTYASDGSVVNIKIKF